MTLTLTNDLDIQTWPRYGQDVPSYQKWNFYVNSLKSYGPNRQTDRQTHTHTRHMTKTLPLPHTREVIKIEIKTGSLLQNKNLLRGYYFRQISWNCIIHGFKSLSINHPLAIHLLLTSRRFWTKLVKYKMWWHQPSQPTDAKSYTAWQWAKAWPFDKSRMAKYRDYYINVQKISVKAIKSRMYLEENLFSVNP